MTSSRKSSASSGAISLVDRIAFALNVEEFAKASSLLQVALLRGMNRPAHEMRSVETDAFVRLVTVASTVIEAAAVKASMEHFYDLRDKLAEQETSARNAGVSSQASFIGTIRALVEMDLRRLSAKLSSTHRIVMGAIRELPLLTLLNVLGGDDGK